MSRYAVWKKAIKRYDKKGFVDVNMVNAKRFISKSFAVKEMIELMKKRLL
ncbi:MAG: hypothetical protein PUD22_08450 [Erysipelotrichaceae bacterium]|nr:hypothetical protein [Erysipelotrichaceae bacterium]